MNEDVRKLLAGYATNTLTEAERRELFDASLHDPALFEALADEQALRDLLDDPVSRAALLARIEPVSPSFRDRFAAWLRRPATVAVLGTAAVAITAISILPLLRHTPAAAPVQETAKMLAPAAPEAPPPSSDELSPQLRRSVPKREETKAKEAASPAAPPPPPKALEVPAVALNGNRPRPEETKILEPPVNEFARGNLEPKAAPAPAAPPAQSRLADAAVQSMAYQPTQAKADKKGGLRYAILKRNVGGDYIEVPPGTDFEPGDTVRVRVETSRPALVTIVEPASGRTMFSRHSTGVAETGDILLTADQTLEITEAPLPSASPGAIGGVIGGFPGALPQAAAERSKTEAPAMAARKVSVTPSVTILLHVKKR